MNFFLRIVCLGLILLWPLRQEADAQTCQWQSPEPEPLNFELTLPTTPAPDFLDGKSIGHITFTRYNVFNPEDPKESNFLYRWLNDVHVISQEQVIRDEILFRETDQYNGQLFAESERILRNNKYLYDARVRPLRLCGDKVDIEVVTKDAWSITPAFSISHKGGETTTKTSITESNFLGSGKLISISQAKDDQRTEYTVRYKDPNIAGTRRKTAIEISDNSDGYRQYFSLDLPFYSLASQRSYGFSFNNEQRISPLYYQSKKAIELDHKNRIYNIFYGRSKGYIEDTTKRWRYGFTYRQDTLKPDAVIPRAFGLDSPNHLALTSQAQHQRTLLYPWLAFDYIENSFTTIENFHSIKRTEDINLGRSLTGRIGYSHHSVANDISRVIFNIHSQNAIRKQKHLLTFDTQVDGYWQSKHNKFENLAATFNGAYYHFYDSDWVFFSQIKYNMLYNPHQENQLFLGGDTGLRGYPLRHLSGEQTGVLTFEQRYYSDAYLFRLIRIGAAFYVDIGKSWGDSHLLEQYDKLLTAMPPEAQVTAIEKQDKRWLANVGIGLRFTPSRVDANHVIHVDLAFPLANRQDIKSSQFLISVKQSF
ncbi:hypothetical protein [Psychrobium sp. 1_MG-2023]|uniref:BamA/TamA family outer membrane protein n=1 Tax=Psychrobium sp. 1_MG-2023 TaxID=3062624 RepID=UPI000C31F1F7|nr:hypothetical protein [Psychrobium sp. 1_MG-2023]MDP2562724.1 hypothetical protein [Psychrobium sp. 1_MG-2023]PKF54014.1 hypothetical protein CW748_17140 [Alteromonadales bacterium alter-6D02]